MIPRKWSALSTFMESISRSVSACGSIKLYQEFMMRRSKQANFQIRNWDQLVMHVGLIVQLNGPTGLTDT